MLTKGLPTNDNRFCETTNAGGCVAEDLTCDAVGECITNAQTSEITNVPNRNLDKLPYGILKTERKIPPLTIFPLNFRKKEQKWRCCNVNEKIPEKKCLPTIEGPFGILQGIFKLDDFLVSLEDILPADVPEYVSRALQALSSCLIAFGHIFLTPESEWTVITLSETLEKGKLLYQDSIRKNAPQLASIKKEYVSNQFMLCQNQIVVEISEPIIVGVLQCTNARVYSLIVGLEMFFQRFHYCLCEIYGNFFLIWKTNNSFFLYDCYGRNERGFRNTQDGMVVLICVCKVRNIGIILEHMTKLRPDAVYTLYELKMKGILKCCDKPMKFQSGPRKQEYQILSQHHAILEGKLHIDHSSFRDSLQKQALATCVVGIAYSKIDPPSSWDSSIVDNVMVMGHRLHQTLTENDPERCISIDHIPANLPLGQFTITIQVIPWAFESNWSSGQSCKNNEAIQQLKCLFRNKSTKNVIFQVNNRIYALWERNRFYYVLDPYCRSLVEAAYSSNPKKCSTLHMADSMDQICSALNQYVILANGPTDFCIHIVKVTKVRKVAYDSLPASEKKVSSVVSATRRNFSRSVEKTNDGDPKNDDVNDDVSEYYAFCASQKIPIHRAEEVESLNDSVYDNQCLVDIGGKQEMYDLGDDDLNNPIYSENQLIFSSDDDYQCGENLEEEDEEEGNEEEEDEEDDSRLEETVDRKSYKTQESLTEEDLSDTRTTGSTDTSGGVAHGASKRDKKRKGHKDERKRKGKDHGKSKDVHKDEHKGRGDKGKGSDHGKKQKENETEKGREKHRGKHDGSVSTTDEESTDYAEKEPSRDKHQSKEHATDHDRGKKKKDEDRSKGSSQNDMETSRDESMSHDKRETGGRDNSKDQAKGHQKGKDKQKSSHSTEKNELNTDSDQHSNNTVDTISTPRSLPDVSKPTKEKRVSSFDEEKDGKKGGSRDRGDQSKDRPLYSSEDGSRPPRRPSKKPFGEGSIDEEREITNSYPGYSPVAHNMAVIGSENGSYKSFCSLISSGFRVADRILAMTPWGNYALFKTAKQYFLFDGCTCNAERFRHLDLEVGTGGLLSFSNMHELILKIQSGQKDMLKQQNQDKYTVDEICREFCK